jgi:hypothetical protein
MENLVENRMWEVFPEDCPYGSLDALMLDVVGLTYKEVQIRIKAIEDKCKRLSHAVAAENPTVGGDALASIRAEEGKKGAEHGKFGGRGNKKPLGGPPTKGFSGQRTDRKTSEHLIRRLAGIDADTGSTWISRYQSGEFKTVSDAARAAGIQLRPTITLASPEAAVRSIVRLQGEEYVRDMVVAIKGNLSPEFVAQLRILLND